MSVASAAEYPEAIETFAIWQISRFLPNEETHFRVLHCTFGTDAVLVPPPPGAALGTMNAEHNPAQADHANTHKTANAGWNLATTLTCGLPCLVLTASWAQFSALFAIFTTGGMASTQISV